MMSNRVNVNMEGSKVVVMTIDILELTKMIIDRRGGKETGKEVEREVEIETGKEIEIEVETGKDTEIEVETGNDIGMEIVEVWIRRMVAIMGLGDGPERMDMIMKEMAVSSGDCTRV